MLTKNEEIVEDEIFCPYNKEEWKIASHSYHEICKNNNFEIGSQFL